MNTCKKVLRLNPVSGYGWRKREKNELVAVPDPFTVDLTATVFEQSDRCYFGKINEKNHQYENLWALLSLRTAGADGEHYNVMLFKQEPHIGVAGELIDESSIEISGFAYLE